MSIREIFRIVVVIFTVTNLMAMGLESTLRDALRTLGSPRFIILTIVWSWVLGPALAWLITWAIPGSRLAYHLGDPDGGPICSRTDADQFGTGCAILPDDG